MRNSRKSQAGHRDKVLVIPSEVENEALGSRDMDGGRRLSERNERIKLLLFLIGKIRDVSTSVDMTGHYLHH